jgi:hypothetical protein
MQDLHRVPPLEQPVIGRLVILTNTEPRHQARHGVVVAVAAAKRVLASSVQGIYRIHQFRPFRFQSSKLFNAAAFAGKVHDVISQQVQ